MTKTIQEIGAINKAVGVNVKTKRTSKGLTRKELAKQINISFQQLQKYEEGIDRMSAGRLVAIADALNIRVGVLFETLQDEVTQETASDRQVTSIAKHFPGIADPKVRAILVTLVRSLSKD